MKNVIAGALVAVAMLSCVQTCTANPVPDEVAQDFKNLVSETARTGKCSDPSRLAEYFGRYGTDLLSQAEIAGIERQFDIFAPILVESQRPPRRLSYDVQALYRKHASRVQRESMLHSLREWLTAPLLAAPWGGIVAPSSMVRGEVQRARVIAAEMLSAWRDDSAGSLMATIAASDTLLPEYAWHLDRARLCLTDSTAKTFIMPRGDGSIQLLKKVGDVEKLLVQQGNLAHGKSPKSIKPSVLEEIWSEIGSSVVVENTGWLGSGQCIVLEFDDGVRACLDPTEPGHVVYTDNTSLDWRRRLTLDNKALWSWVSNTLARELPR